MSKMIMRELNFTKALTGDFKPLEPEYQNHVLGRPYSSSSPRRGRDLSSPIQVYKVSH